MQTSTVHLVDDDAALHPICASALVADPVLDRPACLLLDVRPTYNNGLDIQAGFHASGTTIPIVFLTGYGTVAMTVRARRGGRVPDTPADDDAILEAVAPALAVDAAAQAIRAAQARSRAAARRPRPRRPGEQADRRRPQGGGDHRHGPRGG